MIHQFLFLIFAAFTAVAQPQDSGPMGIIQKRASERETAESILWNQGARSQGVIGVTKGLQRPVEDYADFGFVLMSAETSGIQEARDLRRIIAQNLPQGVFLVILTSEEYLEETRRTYSQWISQERLILATHPTYRNGFWARDSFPVPVYVDDREVGLVAARYFRNFDGHSAISSSVGNRNLFPKEFRFVGGNLLADHEGNCFVVASSRMFGLTGDEVAANYGCKTMEVLPYRAGIGDVDEVVKPLPGKRMITNESSYIPRLKELGYQITVLPDLAERYRTYVNSLVVNNFVFMPVYGVPEDQEATKVYEGLGFRVVPIPSNTLSDRLQGSIHCQTMAYPRMDVEQFLKLTGLKRL